MSKKKFVPLIVYILGWVYPISLIACAVLDEFVVIRQMRGGPFDLNNDSMIAWVAYSIIFGIVTFFVFFISCLNNREVKGSFSFTLLNLPMYFMVLISACNTDAWISYEYYWLIALTFLAPIALIVYTAYVSVYKTKEKKKLK